MTEVKTSKVDALKQQALVPLNLSAQIIQPLIEKSFCDLCCKPLATAFELNCQHCYCYDCVLAIFQQDNIEVKQDLLKQAEETALKGKAQQLSILQILTQEQLQTSNLSMTQQSVKQTLECPLCLRSIINITAINPKNRYQSKLCQECQLRERTIKCISCGVELCQDCDQKIHSFSTTKSHQRTPIANLGNAQGQEVQLPCQCQYHKTIISKGVLRNDPSILQNTHPLLVTQQQVDLPAEYYCTEDCLLICKFCKNDPSYKSKQCIQLNEGVELRIRDLRAETDRCRQLTGELKQLVLKHFECDNLDEQLYQLAIQELQTTQDSIKQFIDIRFQALEAELGQVLEKRKVNNVKQLDKLQDVVGKMMDSVTSAEKHLVGRQPIVFLSEYRELQQKVKFELQNVLTELEVHQDPQRTAFPRLEEVQQLKKSIENLSLNETQQFVEQAGQNAKVTVQCKECSNVLVAGVSNLRQVAKKQKGCLLGLLLEQLEPESVCLDVNKGTPGSRQVLCRKCGRELGRWAQPDAVEKKFTPGYVFISTNVVK